MYWVFIERSAYPYSHHDIDVFVGPFAEKAAAKHAMNHALLIDHLLQREGGGGTDCFVTTNQPGDADDVYIIDPKDPDHTGEGYPTELKEDKA